MYIEQVLWPREELKRYEGLKGMSDFLPSFLYLLILPVVLELAESSLQIALIKHL